MFCFAKIYVSKWDLVPEICVIGKASINTDMMNRVKIFAPTESLIYTLWYLIFFFSCGLFFRFPSKFLWYCVVYHYQFSSQRGRQNVLNLRNDDDISVLPGRQPPTNFPELCNEFPWSPYVKLIRKFKLEYNCENVNVIFLVRSMWMSPVKAFVPYYVCLEIWFS